jgi:hypothetical protein
MEPSTALSTSAQIATAIAGFAGVVATFRDESVHNWGQVQKFWLRLLLIAVCLLQLFNVTILDSFWPFFGAIVAPLLGAMYQFMRLVLVPLQPDT